MNTTFDLNAYGVQEMSHQEMVETNGGIVPIVVVKAGKWAWKGFTFARLALLTSDTSPER